MSAFLASVIVLAVIVGVLRLILIEIDLARDPASPDGTTGHGLDVEKAAAQGETAGGDVGQEQEPAKTPPWAERGAVAVERHRIDARIRLLVLIAGVGTLVAALVSATIALIARVAR